jgi:hypothetical protein
LHPDGVSDRFVLHGTQLAAGVESIWSEAVSVVPDPRFVHAFGAQQAADMIGSERRRRWHGDPVDELNLPPRNWG